MRLVRHGGRTGARGPGRPQTRRSRGYTATAKTTFRSSLLPRARGSLALPNSLSLALALSLSLTLPTRITIIIYYFISISLLFRRLCHLSRSFTHTRAHAHARAPARAPREFRTKNNDLTNLSSYRCTHTRTRWKPWSLSEGKYT